MECLICADPYTVEGMKRPAVLPNCGHTFCFECLSRLLHQHVDSIRQTDSPLRPRTQYPIHPSNPHVSLRSLFQSNPVEPPRCPSCRLPVGHLDDQNLLPNYALISIILETEKRAKKDEETKLQTERKKVQHTRCSPSEIYCVDCDRLVCASCCSSVHLHLPSNQSSPKAVRILESLIEELVCAQSSAVQLNERLRLCRDKHLGQIKSASTNADMIFRLRMEEIDKHRTLVNQRFMSLHAQWTGLWDTLIQLVKGQFSYIESGLRNLLDRYSANATVVEPNSPGTQRTRKRLRTSTRDTNHNISDSRSDFHYLRLLLNESEDITNNMNAGFLEQLECLSLSNEPSGSRPNSNSDDDQYKRDIIQVLRSVTAPVQQSLPSNSVRTSCRNNNSELNSLDGRQASNSVAHSHPPTSNDLQFIISLLSEGWKLFLHSEPLRDLLIYFNLPTPKPPDEFTRFNLRNRKASQFVIPFPQVFPGLRLPPENLITIEYVPLLF